MRDAELLGPDSAANASYVDAIFAIAQSRGFKISIPPKSFTFPMTTTQPSALATAAIIMSIAPRGPLSCRLQP